MGATVRIVFAGTPEFAIPALTALINSSHTIVAVYTQPDRPAGRGRKLTASPVKQLASQHQLPVYQPITLRDERAQAQLAALAPDVMVVVAYGLILPKLVLAIPTFGCINIHPSLLPRWRGAAPVQHTILAGDKISGVTIMQMDEGLDSGPILKQMQYRLTGQETSQELLHYFAKEGAQLLLTTLTEIAQHKVNPAAQNHTLATYAHKLDKSQAKLDWQQSAEVLARQVRAFNPWPIAYTEFNGNTWRIWQAQALVQTTQATPGTILQADKQGIDIATAHGVLRLLTIQLPGGKPLAATDFLNAYKIDSFR